MKDCRNCEHWESCPCGKMGHEKGASIGYSAGECKDYADGIDLNHGTSSQSGQITKK